MQDAKKKLFLALEPGLDQAIEEGGIPPLKNGLQSFMDKVINLVLKGKIPIMMYVDKDDEQNLKYDIHDLVHPYGRLCLMAAAQLTENTRWVPSVIGAAQTLNIQDYINVRIEVQLANAGVGELKWGTDFVRRFSFDSGLLDAIQELKELWKVVEDWG